MLPFVGSCGGGDDPDPDFVVAPGFNPRGDVEAALNWESTGGDGDGGVGAGADGDGGVGVGGDFGQFRNTLIIVRKPDGTEVGRAKTDDRFGMITIKPGKYQGALLLEMVGGDGATYYEEGKGEYVPFPAGQVIRAWVPRIDKNIGITPFTETAYQLLTEGSTPERVSGTPNAAQIRAANDAVRKLLNDQFPKALEVSDITRLPYIKSPNVANAISTDPRGVYGLVNGAFSKQAAMFNPAEANPTLAALRQLSSDLLDGRLDGTNQGQPAVPADRRTYDPNTLTGELTSALAEQTFRFGTTGAQGVLPPVLNFGNSRYEGYFFDASLKPGGQAVTTVAGWVVSDNQGRPLGTESPPKVSPTTRMFGVFGNMGHGGVLLKSDAPDSRSTVYGLGDNVYGEVGERPAGARAGAALPIALPGIMTHAAGGFGHTVVRLADGSVWTWGDNSFGQLGQGQDGTALPRSATPLRVNLPVGALAVAATNAASYAMLADGRVFSWGSNWGFGLLGDGNQDGSRTTAGAVLLGSAELTDVVQINARDNDVIVARRDGTIITWGSHPSDPAGGFVPGDLGRTYQGGTLLPTVVSGLPTPEQRTAGVQVRKILTEQGLFAALMSDGSVWAWGVHFDITAQQILRDLEPRRVLSVPRLRDLMPGGYIGYGSRPFDRLTAMGIDYLGGMWKIRGRVAEQFNPAQPTLQRRPQGLAARPDCESCHVVITDWPLTNPVTPSSTPCVPPSGIHGAGSASLIKADSTCEKCHNPARVKTPPLTFAPDGWLTCARPTDLPPRDPPAPPVPLSGTCTLPAGHRFTPPGTTCSSCHNDIIARPLTCAQPDAATLPTILTSVLITAVDNGAGTAYTSGAVTSNRSVRLQGTLGAALQAGQVVRLLRNGVAAGEASAGAGATAWSVIDTPPDGNLVYAARVEQGTAFGAASPAFLLTVDTTPPAQTTSIEIFDDVGNVVIADNGFSTDTTPVVRGTLSAPLATGETLRIIRNGTLLAATATVNGTGWSYAETSPLGVGQTTSYAVRPIDAAGNLGAASATRSVQTIAPLPVPVISLARNDQFVTIPAGSATPDTTPELVGGVASGGPLQLGQQVRVFRNNVSIGVSNVDPPTFWGLTDPGAPQGAVSYTARVEFGGVIGPLSAPFNLVIDSVAPTVSAFVTSLFDDFAGTDLGAGATTADNALEVRGSVSGALAGAPSPERVQVERSVNSQFPSYSVLSSNVPVSGSNWSFQDVQLSDGSYLYRARVVDAAGNVGPASTPWSVVINTSTRTATPTGAEGNAQAIANGSGTRDTTPTITGVLNVALAPNQTVRVLRNGVLQAAAAVVTGNTWRFDEVSALAEARYTYTARVDTNGTPGAVSGTSWAVVVDTADPVAPQSFRATSDLPPFNNRAGATADSLLETAGGFVGSPILSNDTTPRIVITLPAALSTGAGSTSAESLEILRDGVLVVREPAIAGLAAPTSPLASIPCPSGSPANTRCFREVSGVAALASPGTAPSAAASRSYTARVRDTAGNVSSPVNVTIDYDYHSCNYARAQARSSSNHGATVPPLVAGSCTGCHTQVFPTASPNPTFMRAPADPISVAPFETYWCKVPPINRTNTVFFLVPLGQGPR
jgi:hypothetical protein